jgi:hypothetical protein
MGWNFFPASQCFAEYKEPWDRLNLLTHNHILLDSSFVGLLVEYFGHETLWLGVHENGQGISGLVLVAPSRSGFWQTFQPAQAPMGLLVSSPSASPQIFVKDLLRSLPGFGLGMSFSQLDPAFLPFVMSQLEKSTEVLNYIQTARINILGTFEEYWNARPSEIKKNLDKRKRRLEREGLRYRMVSAGSPDAIHDCVKEFGELEQSGWKGREGTAVSIGNGQGRFYQAVLETLCQRGEGVVYKWLINDEVVASNLCARRQGMLVILKTAYSDDKKAYSPGLFLQKELLQFIFQERTITTVEFYGKVLDWHRNFSDDFRQMFHLTCYRNDFVRIGRMAMKSIIQRKCSSVFF